MSLRYRYSVENEGLAALFIMVFLKKPYSAFKIASVQESCSCFTLVMLMGKRLKSHFVSCKLLTPNTEKRRFCRRIKELLPVTY